MTIDWTFHAFDTLHPTEIHAMFELRVNVFVVEQQCPYPEVDALDLDATHVLGMKSGAGLVAYARIIPAHGDIPPHIGRVVVHAHHRHEGVGHELLRRVLDHLDEQQGSRRSALAAQHHLQAFYEHHGFRCTGDAYDLDGIPHVDMVRTD